MEVIRLKLCLVIVLTSVLLGACTNDVEYYSCSKEIDGWVKENLGEIRKMNRKEWLKSSWVYAKAIYAAFTPEQKLAFWNDKLEEVKKLPWSEEELAHIELAQNFINSHSDLFDRKLRTDDKIDEIDKFYYKWRTTAENKLNWNNKIIKAITACGHSVKNIKGDVIKLAGAEPSDIMAQRAEENCKCSTKNDWCFTSGECIKWNCEYVTDDCGFFLLYDCDGMCSHVVGEF